MRTNLLFQIFPDGIAELVFDLPGEKVNMLTAAVMADLNELLTQIQDDPAIKALVIKSAKPGIFIVGADIREIADIKTPEQAAEKSAAGQIIINKIEKLPFPTFCVINGACVGGGLELALSCTYRVVSDSKKTQLGLPETTLGIIPGFGGTVRLPRLVGLRQALSMILSGKPVDGTKAFKIKLADAVYPEAFLDDSAAVFVKDILSGPKQNLVLKRRKKNTLSGILLEGTPIGRMLVFSAAEKDLLKKTHGFYPAPVEALSVIQKNYKKSLPKALLIENEGFSKLAGTDVSKKLIDIFFLSEELKKAYPPDAKTKKKLEGIQIKSAGVLGAGKMGGGIAWLFSSADIPIRMKDINWNAITAGYQAIHSVYSDLKKIRKYDAREIGLKTHKVTTTIDYSGFSNLDVVVEAIIEDKAVKMKTLQELESKVRDDTIIATNTSSLSLQELSAGLKHPERFVGFHFFNPVNRMPLIEVVKGPKSADWAVHAMIGLARKLKKTPILVHDTNGFLVNRILMAYLNEAMLILEEGAGLKEIDAAITGFGLPMGPFTLLDEIGIPVGFKVAKILFEAFPDRSETGSFFDLIESRKDLLGKSSGKGFYIYGNGKKTPNPEISYLLKQLKFVKFHEVSGEEIQERCLLRMINEAAYCMEEGIIDRAGYLDMALILGAGFPPFRGGLLRYADDTGIKKIVENLWNYEKIYGRRFKPGKLLQEIAEKGGRFYL